MTPSEAASNVDEARCAVLGVFAGWHGSRLPDDARNTLERILARLAPMGSGSGPQGRMGSLRLNAQISVDTGAPDRLRLTVDPFAGQSFQEVQGNDLVAVLDALACPPLAQRALRLHALGYALPSTFWVGAAPLAAGCVVKAYVSSPDPVLRPWLAHLTRDAGWLPPTLQPPFLALYEQLTPSLATLEGIGISFGGAAWLGTTFYLRSSLSWAFLASDVLAALLRLSPSSSLENLADVFPDDPAPVGWSLECDADGGLVDLKLEMAVSGSYSAQRVAVYARTTGLDPQPLEQLASAIEAARLSLGGAAVPLVLSLRFVKGLLVGIVAYYPLAVRS